jgi:hypothetical protein
LLLVAPPIDIPQPIAVYATRGGQHHELILVALHCRVASRHGTGSACQAIHHQLSDRDSPLNSSELSCPSEHRCDLSEFSLSNVLELLNMPMA